MFKSGRSEPRRRPISQRIYRRLLHKYFSHDLNFELQAMARREAALYVREHMAAAVMYADRWDLLRSAIKEASPEGLFLEFGVEKGASANFIADKLNGLEGATLHPSASFEVWPGAWHGTFEAR